MLFNDEVACLATAWKVSHKLDHRPRIVDNFLKSKTAEPVHSHYVVGLTFCMNPKVVFQDTGCQGIAGYRLADCVTSNLSDYDRR